ncbi:hypothetical protein E2C05_24875 [Paracraurococcus ruber]|nr:hypothetical protein E2C05_24875 [Paracraurococcus ruber]
MNPLRQQGPWRCSVQFRTQTAIGCAGRSGQVQRIARPSKGQGHDHRPHARAALRRHPRGHPAVRRRRGSLRPVPRRPRRPARRGDRRRPALCDGAAVQGVALRPDHRAQGDCGGARPANRGHRAAPSGA